jgi:hypothetical protein
VGTILSRKLLGLAIASLLPFLLVSALLTPQPLTATQVPLSIESFDEVYSNAHDLSPDATSEDDEDGVADLRGNRVSSAVATYKFDATGGLYETHSPQTELPRLAPPKS